MKGTPAIYLGRIVEKKHFRTFIYGPNGAKKLVESWDAFEADMQSGLWFATIEDARASCITSLPVVEVEDQEPKPKSKQKPKSNKVVKIVDVLPDDGSVIDVTSDFLPDEAN